MVLYKPSDINTPVLSQFSLHGKIAAVTGGARGIGVEVVRGLAEAGASVALIYTSSTTAEETAAAISKATGQKVVAYQSDVKDREAITATINKVCEDFGGRLDIVIANAGITSGYAATDITGDQWADIMRVNLDGAMWTAQAAGNIFKRQGKGNLVFTISVSAYLVNLPQTQAAYNASKAGCLHLAKCLAVEWADFARVNCISPGFIETDMLNQMPVAWREKWLSMVPGKRFCDPAELKSAYVFLSSDACSYMTGADIIVDGGYTLT